MLHRCEIAFNVKTTKTDNPVKYMNKKISEMLLTYDINKFRKFVNDNKFNFQIEFIEAINQASDEIVEVAMHHCIVTYDYIPKEAKQRSVEWLLDKGYNPFFMDL